MRAYVIIPMAGGAPDLPEETPIKGYVLGAQHNNIGLYLIGGTTAQVVAVDALPNCVGICTVKKLGDTLTAARRAKINAWKDATFPNLPDMPANWTGEQVVRELYKRANGNYKHEVLYIKGFEPGDEPDE